VKSDLQYLPVVEKNDRSMYVLVGLTGHQGLGDWSRTVQRCLKDCVARSERYHVTGLHLSNMAERILKIAEAQLEYDASEQTLIRRARKLAKNPDDPDRKYLHPSVEELTAIKRAGGKYRYKFSTEYLDKEFSKREVKVGREGDRGEIDDIRGDTGNAATATLEEMKNHLKVQVEKQYEIIARRDAEVLRKDKEIAKLQKTLWRAGARNMKLVEENAELKLQLPAGVIDGQHHEGKENGAEQLQPTWN